MYLPLLLVLLGSPLRAQLATPCGPVAMPASFDSTDRRFHRYEVLTPLGVGDSTQARALYVAMAAEAQRVAPVRRRDAGPLQPCDTVEVRIGPTRRNPILVVMDSAALTFVNYSLPGHILHPGWVRRQIVVDQGQLLLRTYSEGTGRLPRLDERLGPRAWRRLDGGLQADF